MNEGFIVTINAVNKFVECNELAIKGGDIVDKEISSGKYVRIKCSGNK